jgi:hypothetical protein
MTISGVVSGIALGWLINYLLLPVRYDGASLDRTSAYLDRWRLDWWAQLLAVSCTTVGAALLFNLRTRAPRVYAFVEMVAGFATAWFAAGRPEPLPRIIGLATATYLLIRAQDNWRRTREVPGVIVARATKGAEASPPSAH